MNKEVLKAMSKKEKKTSNLKKWWNKNNYNVCRVLFFYIYLPSVAYEKIKKYIHKQIVWSEERATEILNYYIPRRAEWDDEKKEFFFFDNGYGWNFRLAKKYLKRKDYAFWKKFGSSWCLEIREFLVKDFELEGFTKEVVEDYYGTGTEIIFKMK